MSGSVHQLNPRALSANPELAALRDGYGEGILKAGRKNDAVVVLSADLTESTRSHHFAAAFPDRFFEIGVAEQNLAAVAAGFALAGKIPFISSYATFSPGRNLEQIRTVICYNNVNVKIAGHHAGLSVGPDGATHQALEDIAITRVLPNMTVVAPCDALETKKATLAAADIKGPVYMRFAREKTAVITTQETPFEIGKATIFWDSTDKKKQVAIIGCGPLLYECLMAAKGLQEEGIGSMVINNHTIKPMDEKTIIRAATECGAVVTVEEHQVMGGMGSAVAELLARSHPVPLEFVGMPDTFGESGEPKELLVKYGMDVKAIKEAVYKVIKRK